MFIEVISLLTICSCSAALFTKSNSYSYLQVDDNNRNVTVIAVRGTDVTRLHDFLEDFKLYTEPVVFTLLSTVFPTMRLWSQDVTSVMIEKLYEFNIFFGLQGEAEYYQPLMKRVMEISAAGRHVVITGHSLGGGLARIVGSLTEQVSFNAYLSQFNPNLFQFNPKLDHFIDATDVCEL